MDGRNTGAHTFCTLEATPRRLGGGRETLKAWPAALQVASTVLRARGQTEDLPPSKPRTTHIAAQSRAECDGCSTAIRGKLWYHSQ